jgi:hypothetical protein
LQFGENWRRQKESRPKITIIRGSDRPRVGDNSCAFPLRIRCLASMQGAFVAL